MALYRTALRLATLEALRPTALLNSEGPWPTLARNFIYDSRLDPLEDLAKDEMHPVVGIYTEGEIGYAGQHAGGPPFRRECDLIFEISHVARVPSDADPNEYEARFPLTDGELEATLDRIETEIAFALFFHPVGKIWRDLTGRCVTDPRSQPHRSTEEGGRLSWRTVCWKVQVPDDLFIASPVDELANIDRLPEPLRGVLKRLEHSAYARNLGLGLGRDMPTMPTATPLTQVALGVEVVRPGAKPTGKPNISGDVTLAGYPTAVVSDSGGSIESV